MLSDAAIERYSRQILLPEVGGRGQERLGSTRVIVSGGDAAAAFATALLGAAGVGITPEDGPPGRLAARLDAGTVLARADGAGAVVVTLVGRPCARCVPETVWRMPAGPAGDTGEAAHAQAVGALVAAETLRVALGLATAGRVHAFDLASGTFEARPLPASDGCGACAGTRLSTA